MENATKALMIAAGVLVGMLIISLGLYLYFSLSDYVSETQEEIKLNEITSFNTQFLNYNNVELNNNGIEMPETRFKVTIQDIITVANIAYENNQKYNLSVENANENTLYVTVNAILYREDGTTSRVTHLEKDVKEKASDWLSYDKGYQYRCSASNIKISQVTGRVYEINFK